MVWNECRPITNFRRSSLLLHRVKNDAVAFGSGPVLSKLQTLQWTSFRDGRGSPRMTQTPTLIPLP